MQLTNHCAVVGIMEGEESVVNIPEQIFFVQVHLFFVGLLLNVDAAQFLEELHQEVAWRWLYTYVSKNEPIFIYTRNTRNPFPTILQPFLGELWLKPLQLGQHPTRGFGQLEWNLRYLKYHPKRGKNIEQ